MENPTFETELRINEACNLCQMLDYIITEAESGKRLKIGNREIGMFPEAITNLRRARRKLATQMSSKINEEEIEHNCHYFSNHHGECMVCGSQAAIPENEQAS